MTPFQAKRLVQRTLQKHGAAQSIQQVVSGVANAFTMDDLLDVMGQLQTATASSGGAVVANLNTMRRYAESEINSSLFGRIVVSPHVPPGEAYVFSSGRAVAKINFLPE